MKIKIIKNKKDIATVARLARIIWTEHYTPMIGKNQVSFMLSTMQSSDAITRQIREEEFTYFLMTQDDKPVGYAAVAPRGKSLFLSKLYIHRAFRGRKIARKTLAHIEKMAGRLRLGKIFLTVNRNNKDSVHAYKKLGFKIKKHLVKVIGDGFVMDDYRMEKNI